MTVKVMRFECVYRPDAKEAFDRVKVATAYCQEIANCIWETWRVWHVNNGSGRLIRDYLDAMKAWHETKDGVKPKLDLQAVPKELANELYSSVSRQFPHVHARVQVLLLQKITKGIKDRKAASGSLSGWMSILLYREGQPSFTRPVPVPFDVQNATLLAPLESGGNHRLSVRVDRVPRDGKAATGHLDEFELLTKRRKIAGQRAILERVMSGEWKFCGSSLIWNAKKRKTFALICYDRGDEQKAAPGAGKAFLRPAMRGPWRLRIGGRSFRRGGHGSHVAGLRRRLLTQRWSRQASYRYAGSANKGHGRKRALSWVQTFSKRWKDFVKTTNHVLTTQTVRECQEKGVGTLVYFQPSDDTKESRFLTTAGKIDARSDSTGWDWHQVKSMLEYKCKETGIHLIVRKSGGRASGDARSKSRRPLAGRKG